MDRSGRSDASLSEAVRLCSMTNSANECSVGSDSRAAATLPAAAMRESSVVPPSAHRQPRPRPLRQTCVGSRRKSLAGPPARCRPVAPPPAALGAGPRGGPVRRSGPGFPRTESGVPRSVATVPRIAGIVPRTAATVLPIAAPTPRFAAPIPPPAPAGRHSGASAQRARRSRSARTHRPRLAPVKIPRARTSLGASTLNDP